MKTLSYSAVLLFSLLFSQFSFAQASITKQTIKVWGNCGMCKKNIEKAATKAGATAASWNEDSKQLQLRYNKSNTSLDKIEQAIADAGYDTQDKTAATDAYNKLHSCCQYDRKETAAKTDSKKCCDSKDCKKDAAHCKEMACCTTAEDASKKESCCNM